MTEEQTIIRSESTNQKIVPDTVKRPLSPGWVILLLGIALVVCTLFSVGTGALHISFSEILGIVSYKTGLTDTPILEEQKDIVFWVIRLPRVCLGILVGAGLGIAGAALQGLFRNPIADATLIGVTSGASLFAVLVIMLNIKFLGIINEYAGAYTLSFAAFAGAALTTMLVYQLSKLTGEGSVTTMLLCGIAINAFVGALTGLMTYMATDEQLRTITFWTLGSLGGANWTTVLSVAPFVGCTILFMPYLAKSLNLLVLGESQAAHLGVNMKVLKRYIIILATMAVGSSVAVAGTIGFVGLVVPHIIRSVFGHDNRYLLVGSAIGGAIVLTLADTISRTIVAPAELPIGILTALLGTPFFLYLLWNQKRNRV
jgi:iron complex transport system permease protein